MKTLFIILGIIFLLNGTLFSQTNSVVLKNTGGTVISQHSSVQAAYDAVTTPVTQAYIIEILTAYDGSSEVFPINFLSKSGVSEANRITIRPAAGNTGEIISGNSTTGIIVFNDADFITIDGRPGGSGSTADLKIQNLSTSGTNANTIHLINGSSNNVIKFVHVLNFTQNTAGPRTISIGTTTTTGNNNNLISYNKIEGGRSGIGFPGTTSTPNDSNSISNNEIFGWGYAGIWIVSGTANTNMDSNKIYQTTGVNSTIVSGIIMSTVSGATYNIRKNLVYDIYTSATSGTMRGIYSASPAAGSTINLENNMVSNMQDNGNVSTVTGFEFLGTNAYTLNVFYNTARIGGTHINTSAGTTSAGFRIGSATQTLTLNMKNNIALNTRTGGTVNHCGFVLLGTAGTLNVDYNCYFANGSNAFNAHWGGTGYNTLADYKTAVTPNEQNTVFQNVNFVSATDLHLTGSSVGDINLKGTPIPGITTDFDNQLRNSIAPYKGADEGSIPLKTEEFTSAPLTYSLSQNYPNPFNPVTSIEFQIPGSNFVKLAVFDIAGKEIGTLVNEYKQAGTYQVSFNAGSLASGVYFYKITSGNFSDTKRMILLK